MATNLLQNVTAPIGSEERTKQLLEASSQVTGLKPTATSGNAITSDLLQPQPKFTTTNLPKDTKVAGMLGEIETGTDNFTKELERQASQAKTGESTSFEELMRGALETPGKTELTAKAEKDAGLTPISDELRGINDQIRQEQNALRRQIERTQTEAGLTKGQVDERTSELERVSLRKQADLYVIQQAVQGKYDSAKAIADRAVAIQTEQDQRKLDLLQLNYERNKDLFTESEKRLFESKQADRKREIDKLEQEKSDIYNIGLTVGQNGGGSQLMQQVFNAKTPQEAAKIGSGYLVDPIDRQLKNISLQNAQINRDLDAAKLKDYNTSTEVLNDSNWSSIINSTASLVGSERGKEIRTNMARNIANGNYKSAWADVTNAVEEKLTGENATKFGASITDYEVLTGLENAIQQYADGGGNMGLLTGKAEDISRKLLGVTDNPKLSALAVQLEREFQTYRTNATGAAFSPEESREYAKVNPRSTASLDLNLATIKGAKNQLENRILSNVKVRVPGAEDLWKINTGGSTSSYIDQVDSVLQQQGSGDEIDSLLDQITKEIRNIK